MISPWLIAPFAALLLAIALAPFVNRHWWEKNYPYVAAFLGAIPVVAYVAFLGNPLRMLATLEEYISFIVLIGSLFVVAGGIHIRIKGHSTPLANVMLLAIGAVTANVVGTTGASMILIRPYLRVNRYRIRPFHVVFFVFIVSNMGGALTPIGDPPLFLGYLKGVPFLWVLEQVWLPWLIAIAAVLAVFYAVDERNFRALKASVRHEAESSEEGSVEGMQNILFIAVIIAAVFVTRPLFLREALMIAAAAGSYFTTKKSVHEKNDFNFVPIREVAILFAGIFATMVPALDWLEANAATLGITTAGQFYWGSGILSSFLDNAPTYLNFLSTQVGLFVPPPVLEQVRNALASHGTPAAAPDIRAAVETIVRYHGEAAVTGTVPAEWIATGYLLANKALYVQAISLGAVFFGACTYIGNGPNFMVKSIADQAGVKTPSFFGYVALYALPVLLPVFAAVWFFFFR
jgi:Na+/H+ antiporter NhaD/arsenite permease-like protein